MYITLPGVQLRYEGKYKPFASYDCRNVSSLDQTTLPWTVCLTIQSIGRHVRCHKLTEGESASDTIESYMGNEDIAALILINKEDNYFIEELPQELNFMKPVTVIKRSDGDDMLNHLDDTEYVQVCLLNKSSEKDIQEDEKKTKAGLYIQYISHAIVKDCM